MTRIRPPVYKENASRGMALVSALLVIIVITSILSTLYYNQTVKFRQVENVAAVSQSRWLLHAMTDGLRYFFQDNLSNGGLANHLGEIWALPLVDANFATILKKYNVIDKNLNLNNINVSYVIEDAQGRFNLTNLVVTAKDKAENIRYVNQVFKTLAIEYGLSDALAMTVITRLNFYKNSSSNAQSNEAFAEIDKRSLFDTFEINERAKLMAFFIVLPEKTQVNINTAKDAVLKALIPEASAETMQLFAARRLNKPFQSTDEIKEFLEGQQPGIKINKELLAVRTNYFKVYAAIRNGDVVVSRALLIGRNEGQSPITRVIESEPENYRFPNEL
jgi:general secretion pathway protein K